MSTKYSYVDPKENKIDPLEEIGKIMSQQPQWKAKIIREEENIAIEVVVPAWNVIDAQKLIYSVYRPVKVFVTVPQEIK